MKVKVVKKTNNKLPEYAYEGSAGMDVRADLSLLNLKQIYGSHRAEYKDEVLKSITIYPNTRVLIPSGLHIAVPKGYEMQIRPRSGLAIKHGITLTNSPATIDFGYTGDCGIIIQNTGNAPFELKHGDRIGQFVLKKVEVIEWDEVDSLDDSDRGEGGFGSSGKA